jgi:DNA-binding HxlR family transcriptional regulator
MPSPAFRNSLKVLSPLNIRSRTNIPTDRLQRLELAGIVVKARDAQDARRFVYRLTDKGIALAPVLVELVLWSAGHELTDAPPEVLEAMMADREGFIAQVRHAWEGATVYDGAPPTPQPTTGRM